MRSTLDDAFVCSRLDAKYGPVVVPRAVREGGSESETVDTTCIRFFAVPIERSRNASVVYVPRPHVVDARRRRFCDVYRDAAELQDLRNIVVVPTCLMHVARAGMSRVIASGPVRIHGNIIAVVSSREVGALLYQVVLNTTGLEPRFCTRLVAHMCKNEIVANEWLTCFGF